MVRLFEAEARRQARLIQAYAVEEIGQFLLFTVGFLVLSGLFEIIARGELASTVVLASAVGFLAWRTADGYMLRTVSTLADDAAWGTLEQLILSPISILGSMVIRGAIVLVFYTLEACLIGLVVFPLLGAWPTLSWAALIVFLIMQTGIWGVALVLAGLHMVYKQIASVTVAVSTALLFLTGALAPLDNVPLLASVARVLPLTVGIEMLRDLMVYRTTVPVNDVFWLVGTTAFYVAVGWSVLTWALRAAQRAGSLAHY